MKKGTRLLLPKISINSKIKTLSGVSALIIALIFVFVGCASNQLDRFDRIKEGMDKDEVLEILGSPARTEKSALEEKWCYKFYVGDNKEVEDLKFVHFIQGKVTAFGEDTEEIKRLQILKEIALKKDALRKEKALVDEKVEKAMKEQKAEAVKSAKEKAAGVSSDSPAKSAE